MSEKRDRRRSVHPFDLARQIQEGWIGQEDLAGLSNGTWDQVWEVSGVRDLKLKMRSKG